VSGYTPAFFYEATEVGGRSAEALLPVVIAATNAQSVIDVGCAEGAWLTVAKQLGCLVFGVDGFAGAGMLDRDEFAHRDLRTEPMDCTGYDLALCLEVGEHLPEDAAPGLVAGLCGADHVLFSAAIPGQGGVDHINERWGSWWAELFATHDYYGDTTLRWQVWNDRRIEGFYRQNLIVFSRDEPQCPVVDVIHPERLGVWP